MSLASGELQQGSEPSEDLDVDTTQPAVRGEDHPVDQATNDWGSLQSRFFVGGQGAREFPHLPSIILSDAGMQGDDRQGIDLMHFSFKSIPIFTGGGENRLDLHKLISTIGDGLHKTIDLGNSFISPFLHLGAAARAVG